MANVELYNSFRKELTQFEKSIMKVLDDSNFSADKFMITVENMVRKTPALLECDRPTLFASILTAAEAGLEPNTPAGLSWIIPRYNGKRKVKEANFQLGYQGVVNLLYRNNRVKKVMAEIVYTNDHFERYIGDDMNWHFVFKPSESKREVRKGVFAAIHIEGAEPIFSYMSAEEIDQIKAKSEVPHMYEVSNDPQGWQWKKAVVKQAAKLAPKNTNLVTDQLNIDSMVEAGATLLLDENGKVIIQKTEKEFETNKKVNVVFGKPGPTEAEVVE